MGHTTREPMKKIVVLGAGDSAREVFDVLDYCNRARRRYTALGYVVDAEYGLPGTVINGRPILGDFTWLKKHAAGVRVVCGIGPSHLRHQVVERAAAIGCRFTSLVHPWTEQYFWSRWSKLGEGCLLYGCGVSDQTEIGDHAMIHGYTIIGHNVRVGAFATISSGVHISGHVTIGMGCYLGSGAVVRDRVSIGEWSFIGAGSVVTKDIPANSVAVGFPARVIERREPGWHLKADARDPSIRKGTDRDLTAEADP